MLCKNGSMILYIGFSVALMLYFRVAYLGESLRRFSIGG